MAQNCFSIKNISINLWLKILKMMEICKKIKNKVSYEQSVPDFIKEISQKNFGTLGTGNTLLNFMK